MKNPKGQSEEDIGVEIPKESVSLTSVFVFLGSIFVLLVIMLFYLRFSSWSPFADFLKHDVPSSLSFSNLYNKEKEKSSSAATLEIKINEDELSETVGVDKKDFPLKKASLKIKPEGIVVAGKTSAGFWGIPIEMVFEPRTDAGKLDFNIKEIKASGVIAPKKISDTLSPKMNNLFAPALSSLGNIEITSARTLVGYMIIEAKQ